MLPAYDNNKLITAPAIFYSAKNALDSTKTTWWETDKDKSPGWLLVNLGARRLVACVMISQLGKFD